MAEIEFRNLSKVFPPGVKAVDDVSLTIADGEFLVLLGPSGCGKSTLLRLLAGLESVTHGEILMDGKRVNDLRPQERDVAMVFQNYALYPHKTVRENLAFPLRMMRKSRKERDERIVRVAEMLGLTPYLDRKPRQLSGGQSQRVAMGRAIVRDSSAFLMDEPLSNLDAKLRMEVRSEIAALQRKLHITTLYVTHDQVEALTLGERIAVLRDGRLQQVDTAQKIFEQPANLFVAGFLGNPGMNLLRCRIENAGEDSLRLSWGGESLVIPSNPFQNQPDGRPASGTTLIVGIRPEAFSPAASTQEALEIKATVKTFEALGHEMIVYLKPRGELVSEDTNAASRMNEDRRTPRLAVRVSAAHQVHTGETMQLYVHPSQFHFFNADGQVISIKQ